MTNALAQPIIAQLMMRHLLSTLGTLLRWGFYGFLVFSGCVYFFLLVFSWHATKRETQFAEDVAPPKGRYVKASDVNIYLQEAGPPDRLLGVRRCAVLIASTAATH